MYYYSTVLYFKIWCDLVLLLVSFGIEADHQLSRQRRQTPAGDYLYTLEVLFVVDPAVVSWWVYPSPHAFTT